MAVAYGSPEHPFLPGFESGGDLPEGKRRSSLKPGMSDSSSVASRLLASDPDSLTDFELLRLAFDLILDRQSAEAAARSALTKFHSVARAASASWDELLETLPEGQAPEMLKVLHAVAVRFLRSEVSRQPVLSDGRALLNYLRALVGWKTVEIFRVLYLGHGNRLVADEEQARGTIDHAPVYPREIARRALGLNATAVILVHNHPGGGLDPSGEDIELTARAAEALSAIGVSLHDHVIVSDKGWISFRQEGLL